MLPRIASVLTWAQPRQAKKTWRSTTASEPKLWEMLAAWAIPDSNRKFYKGACSIPMWQKFPGPSSRRALRAVAHANLGGKRTTDLTESTTNTRSDSQLRLRSAWSTHITGTVKAREQSHGHTTRQEAKTITCINKQHLPGLHWSCNV